MAELISLSRACARAQVSYIQGYRLLLIGQWTGWQEGSRWRVSADSVERWRK